MKRFFALAQTFRHAVDEVNFKAEDAVDSRSISMVDE
jgi:hypothetical protein